MRGFKTFKVDNVNVLKVDNVMPLLIIGTSIKTDIDFTYNVLVHSVIEISCNGERAPPLLSA